MFSISQAHMSTLFAPAQNAEQGVTWSPRSYNTPDDLSGATAGASPYPVQSINQAADAIFASNVSPSQVYTGIPTFHRPANLPPYFVDQPSQNPVSPKDNEVSQLDQAEALDQDAYRIMSNPYSNYVDQQRALEEMQQADQIRHSVESQLTPGQQQSVDHINGLEEDAIKNAESWSKGPLWDLIRSQWDNEMSDGAQESKSLDNWIESQ